MLAQFPDQQLRPLQQLRRIRPKHLIKLHHFKLPLPRRLTLRLLLDLQFLLLVPLNDSLLNTIIPLYIGIEPILNPILRPTRQFLRDLRPPTAILRIQLDQAHIFRVSPVFLLDLWVEFVDVAFADLFAGFGAEHLTQQFPVLAELTDHLTDGVVLVLVPDLALPAELGEAAVAVQALVLVAVGHEAGDGGPALRVLVVELDQELVLVVGPGFDLALFLEAVALGYADLDEGAAAVLQLDG